MGAKSTVQICSLQAETAHQQLCGHMSSMCVYFFVLFCFGDACEDLPTYIAYFLSESDIWDIIAFLENLDTPVSSFPCV